MWPYQHIFRMSVETSVKSALEAVGFTGTSHALLVGFEAEGNHRFPICIDPEDGPYTPRELAHVVSQTEEGYEQHPDRDMLYSDQRSRNLHPILLRRRIRSSILARSLSETSQGRQWEFFASMPARVEDYEVHVVIGLEKSALVKVPRIKTTERDRISVPPSLVHALIEDILNRSTRSLMLPEPGSSLLVLHASTSEILRSATDYFVRSLVYCAGTIFGSDFDLLLNSISSMPYEGRSGQGRIIIAERSLRGLDIALEFKLPVKLTNVRAVRKMLEASGPSGFLLADDGKIYGLGSVGPEYDESSETAFAVTISSRGAWELHHSTTTLLQVRDGVPRLPAPPLDVAYLEDLIARLLPGADVPVLLSLAHAAQENEHGAMLVISSSADMEANRLSPQAWAVTPRTLTRDLLIQMTAMDGATLVDVHGHCHAIGVILDGLAAGKGDPSRGSRYNNAIRYLDSDPPSAIVIVYSSDGTIDILPRLEPRVRRRDVESAVRHYLDLAASGSLNMREISKAWDLVKSLRFYLTAEQCEELNAARLEVERRNRSKTRIIEPVLTPYEEMNDSYWLD
ncbi:hypothetical protein ABZ917_05585 [Nonomuraea wenchangensis]